jgi:GT2 family glycosyltransferase
MTVHAVIVNWNGIEDTLQCIKNLKDQTIVPVLHVVDNGSEDGSAEVLASLGKQIILHRLGSNVGFAAGANVGIRAALEADATFVFLQNNDATCERSAISMLLASALRHPEAGLFGGRIYRDRAQDVLWACGVSMGWSPNLGRLRGHGQRGASRFVEEEEVDSLTGCGLLIRASLLREIGLLDESFFVYVEDADLCARARRAGSRCVYVPSAILEHKGGGSTGHGYGPTRKYLTAYFSVHYLRLHGTAPLYASFLIFDVLALPFTLLMALVTGRGQGALAKAKGLWHGLRNRPFDRRVLKSRVMRGASLVGKAGR